MYKNDYTRQINIRFWIKIYKYEIISLFVNSVGDPQQSVLMSHLHLLVNKVTVVHSTSFIHYIAIAKVVTLHFKKK